MKEALNGIVFPMVTPFHDETEEVNYEGLSELIEFLIENGADGVIPCGSTGELVSMTLEEHMKINEFTIERVAKRIKVYPCKAAEVAGADCVMVVTPWYITPNEVEIRAHYKAVRDAVDIPVMLYHNPYLTSCWLRAEFIAGLYNEGLIDAVKDSAHDIYRHQCMRAVAGDGFGIFYGYDNCPAEALAFYADGWITGVGTLFPAESVKLYRLAKAGRISECKEFTLNHMRKYMRFFNEPTKEGLPIPWLAIIKEGLMMRGINVGMPRKPIGPLPESTREELKKTMIEFGYYKKL
jgi:4-hydroxy-tetrahydrodipicolinate synthase